MNNSDLKAQCEEFSQTFRDANLGTRRSPLDDGFVRRFNVFVAKHPHVLEWKDKYFSTLLAGLRGYLFRAALQRFPLETFQALVIQTPQVLEEKTGNNICTLLHYVCRYNPTALDVVSFFVRQNPNAAKALDDGKRSPLHWACRNKAPLPVIRVLVDAYPRAIQICDRDGDSPLHCACDVGAPLDVIHYLVVQRPNVCFIGNDCGDLPLDRASKRIGRRGNDYIEFTTTATTAAARALMKRLCFRGPAPREIFKQVAAYLPPAEVVSGVLSALSGDKIAVLFRRDGVRAEFLEQIEIQTP